jgi:hypothetical protein
MKTCRGHRSTRRKPAPAPLCPPQIPLDQTRVQIEPPRALPHYGHLCYGISP